MSAKANSDSNSLYVGYWFPPGVEVPARLRSAASEVFASERGTVVEIVRARTKSSHWEDRQHEFDELLAAARSAILPTGFDAERLTACGAQLEVRIALDAREGVAGLFLSNSVLSAWSLLGAEIFLEA